ncbi:MAG: hypothetical protein OHK0029_14670 [Armatimonadaceae bacterium]
MRDSIHHPNNNLLANAGALGIALATLIGAGLMGGEFHKRVEPQVIVKGAGLGKAQQERLEEMATTSLFGQFRSSLSDFLWLKADRILHDGVELRGLTPMEQEAAEAAEAAEAIAVRSAEGEKERGNREHTDETTVVPSKTRDWRGRIGDLERAVKPYEDMSNHRHKDPKEALPLFRLMTLSNPQFIPGYTVGAMLIAQNRENNDKALAYLREGEKNNPQSIEIHTAIGYFLTSRYRRFDEAFPSLQWALAIGAQRDLKTMTDEEREAFQEAFRWMVLNRREAGDQDMARKAAEAGLYYFPDDVICRNYLKQHKK